jgi:argininosuccinate lyase
LKRDLFLEEARLGPRSPVLSLAREHAETVMPGYTHLQHAQPWTFGHYLLRQASVFERDLERLAGAFGRTNRSGLGAAANAGTSWPLDRRRVAELLGHEGLVRNASDAGVFARDYIEEDVACLALLMSNLGRLATDLYVWHAWEFGFVEVADGLAGTSSIMPQKKNPHALERRRTRRARITRGDRRVETFVLLLRGARLAGPVSRRVPAGPARLRELVVGARQAGTRKPSRWAARASRPSSVCSVRPGGWPSAQCNAAPS